MFTLKVHINSQLEKAGYTGRVPGVEYPTNDPHGEMTTAAKRNNKELCKTNKTGTNEGCANIKQAI